MLDKAFLRALVASLFLASACPAAAQTCPSKPVRIILAPGPFSPFVLSLSKHERPGH
jgi:hypothetical protein